VVGAVSDTAGSRTLVRSPAGTGDINDIIDVVGAATGVTAPAAARSAYRG
jgi:hypothetical protein